MISYNLIMKIILYTNTNTGKCVWLNDDHVLESCDESYDDMTAAHMLIRHQYSPDLVEGINLLLKMQGEPI